MTGGSDTARAWKISFQAYFYGKATNFDPPKVNRFNVTGKEVHT